VIDFWFTGCGNCRLLAPFMKKIETLYISKNVQFITISIDKDSSIWKKSIIEGKYTSGMTLNLFTNGLGEEEPVIAKYYIRSYPTIVLIDKQGRIAATPVDPRLDKGKDLINLIDKLM
jgi:thiol-disulfide isomerase/thioredoxin